MKNLKGHISISRTSGHNITHPIRIEIIDDISGSTFAIAELTLENYAEAITGLAYADCNLQYYEDAPVGKTREIKKEQIDITEMNIYIKPKDQEKTAKIFLTPYEIDGWKGDASDLFNHHKQSRKDNKTFANVMFVRYI